MFLAVPRPCEVSASRRVYSLMVLSDVNEAPGKTIKAKKLATINSKMTIMPSIVASSLVNIEGRRAGIRTCLFIAASDKHISASAHSPNECRLSGIIFQLLSQTANQHVNGAIKRLPVNSPSLVHDPVPAEDPAAVTNQ